MREGVKTASKVREGRFRSGPRFERGRGHNSRTEDRSEVTLRKCGTKPAHFASYKLLTTKYTVSYFYIFSMVSFFVKLTHRC